MIRARSFSPSWILRARRTKGFLVLCSFNSCWLPSEENADSCRVMLSGGIPGVRKIDLKAFLQLNPTFLFSGERVQQLFLSVQALQESFLLRVTALPEGLQLIPGLLVLPPQTPFSCVALAHLLTQPVQLGLVHKVNTNAFIFRFFIHRLAHRSDSSTHAALTGFSKMKSYAIINAKDIELQFN